MTSSCQRHLSPPCSRAGVCGSCLREKLADLMEMIMMPSGCDVKTDISKQALSANAIKLSIANQVSLHPPICNLDEDSVPKCDRSLADANETKLTIANQASSAPQLRQFNESSCSSSLQESDETMLATEDQASSNPQITSFGGVSESQCNRSLAEANETKLSITNLASPKRQIGSLDDDSRIQCNIYTENPHLRNKIKTSNKESPNHHINSLDEDPGSCEQGFASESSLHSQMSIVDRNPGIQYDKGVADVNDFSLASQESNKRTQSDVEGRQTDCDTKMSIADNSDKQCLSAIDNKDVNQENRSIDDNHYSFTGDDTGKYQSGSIDNNLDDQSSKFIGDDSDKRHLSFNSTDVKELQQRLACIRTAIRNKQSKSLSNDDHDKHHRSFSDDDSTKHHNYSITMDEYLKKYKILGNDSISETLQCQKSSRITNRIADYSPIPKSSTKEERNRKTCRRSDSGAALSWISMLFSTRSLGFKSRSKKQEEETGYEDVWEPPRPSSYEQLSSFERHSMALSSWPELDINPEENIRVSDADRQDSIICESVQCSVRRDRKSYDADDRSSVSSHRRKSWMKAWLSKLWPRRAKKKDKNSPESSGKLDYQRVQARHSFSDSFHNRYYQNPLFENRSAISRRSYSSSCYSYSPSHSSEARHSHSKASTRHIQQHGGDTGLLRLYLTPSSFRGGTAKTRLHSRPHHHHLQTWG